MTLTNLLRYISLKRLALHKTQAIIAACGICLGVATMVSIDLVNRSVLNSFQDSIDRLTGRAALQITGAEAGFPETMLERVQKVPGVEYAVPLIQTNASLVGGSERPLLILGVDVLQDNQVRDYSITDDSADIPDPLLFLARPDSILLTRALAEREGIKIDQDIRLQTVAGIKTFTVRGLLNPEGPARVAGGDVAVMDVYAAQLAFGKEGLIDSIDVSFRPGVTLDTMEQRIRAALPKGYYVDTPAGRTRQVEIMLSRFSRSMSVISFMAMFVGMYLIYNAVSISVVQRRKEIGILRALGTLRGQIVGLFLGETALIAAFASLLGVGLGVVFAKGAVGLVARSVTEIYVKTSVTGLSFAWSELFRDVALGLAASLLAALVPALTSARITPISAIRALPYSGDGLLANKGIEWFAALLVSVALLLLIAYRVAAPASFIKGGATIGCAAVLLLLGVSLATPFLLRKLMPLFHRWVAARSGAVNRLAGLNIERNVGRNAVAASAIFFSIALFVSSANMVHSLRQSMITYIDSIIRADLLLSSGHPLATGGSPTVPMPMSMLAEIDKVPGVLSAEPFRKGYIDYDGRRVLLEIFDVALRLTYCPGLIAQGSREDMRRLMPNRDNVVVNEGFAARYGLKPGDTLLLPTPAGPVRFGVAAVVVSYTSDSGSIWMDIHTYQRHWQDRVADMFEVRMAPGFTINGVRDAILARFGRERKLFVLPAREFKEEVFKMIDRSFVVTNAVNTITLVIAAFGIVVTLLASVLERTREIGILRSIGMQRRQIAGIVLVESALLGAVGGVLGSATGILIGWISFEGFFRQEYGASMSYHIHYAAIAGAVLLAVAVAALAGLYPARRAARTNIVEALSYE
jgi:putative ABC transport system permease protein